VRSLALFAIAAALVVSVRCLPNPWDECSEVKEVAPGEKLGGVDPASSVAPLIGSHPATLTWSYATRSTACHLDFDRDAAAPIPAPIGCDNAVTGFDVDVTLRLRTDDGLIDETGDYRVKLDPGGRQAGPIRLVFYPSFDKLKDAGVTRPGAIGGYRVEIAIPISNLAVGNGTVRMTWWDPDGGTQGVSMGDIVFQ
jgi:hypothetical protein